MVNMKVPSGQLDDVGSGTRGVIPLGNYKKTRDFERCCKQSLTGSLLDILMLAVSSNLKKNLQSQVLSLKKLHLISVDFGSGFKIH